MFDFPRMHVVYSGSSLLRLEGKGGDLSRRRVAYNLAGLSFREYLRFEGVGDFPPFNLADVLEKHVKMADEICGQVKVLKYFDRYRLNGFYPFYKEGVGHYQDRLLEVVNKVLESDYPAVEEVEVSTIRKARRMLDVLSASAPLTPNMERLYAELGTDRKQGLKMLYALERAGLLSLLVLNGLVSRRQPHVTLPRPRQSDEEQSGEDCGVSRKPSTFHEMWTGMRISCGNLLKTAFRRRTRHPVALAR